jgi:hypothetical protein
MAQVDKYGFKTKGTPPEQLAQKVKSGMAFVMPIANNPYDHVGLVDKVLPDGIMTNEANADGRAKTANVGPGKNNITSRFIPWNQLYGFMAPPSAKSVGGSPIASSSTNKLNMAALQQLTTKELKAGFEDGTYDLNNLTPKAFDKVKQVLGEENIKRLQGGNTATTIPLQVRAQLQRDPSVEKVKSANGFNLALQAYKDLVDQTPDLERWGANKAKLDSAYSNLKVAFKNAAELGAIAAADVPLIESSIKPITKDAWDVAGQAQFGLEGGKQGVLNSLETALSLSNEKKAQAAEELIALYPEYADSDYFNSLIGKKKEPVALESDDELYKNFTNIPSDQDLDLWNNLN